MASDKAFNIFEKLATTKLIKLVRSGDLSMSTAGRVAKKLNLSPRVVKSLGEGREGIADLAIGSNFGDKGYGVIKTFNPGGPLYSSELFKEKVRNWEKLKGNKFVAKFFGSHRKKPITYHEFVHGRHPAPLFQESVNPNFSTSELHDYINRMLSERVEGYHQIKKGIRGVGAKIQDINNPGNIIITDKGIPKLIDFLPKIVPDSSRRLDLVGRVNIMKAVHS